MQICTTKKQGSGNMSWKENVVTNVGSAEWLHIWTSSIHDVAIADNYVDTKKLTNKGVNCTVVNTTVFKSGSSPKRAFEIIAMAGANATRPFSPGWTPAPAPMPNPPPAPSPPAPPVAQCPNAKAAAKSLAAYKASPGLIGFGEDVVPKGFECVSVECCPGESALACDKLGKAECKGFALNKQDWFRGLRPQMFSNGTPSPKHPHGGWTFYGKA